MDYLVIVAAGKGLRMGADIPKQFLPLCGRPILMRTIERFLQALPRLNVIIVLNPDCHNLWHDLCDKNAFHTPCTVVAGGTQRFHSVRNGLQAIDDNDPDAVVAVHDAVRPLVSIDVIRTAYDAARSYHAVIPVIPAVDSVRILDHDKRSHHIDRNKVIMVQTPQTFSLQLLRQAYQQPYTPDFTDDASVVEAAGHNVHLIHGNSENIKITTPTDMAIATALLQR